MSVNASSWIVTMAVIGMTVSLYSNLDLALYQQQHIKNPVKQLR